MSAASPSVQAGSSTRQFNLSVFALLLAVAALVMVAYGQAASTRQAVAPAAAPAQLHDHGWSSAAAPLQGTLGWAIASNSAAIDAARHPSRATVTMTPDGIRIQVPGGGLLYNGIPYTGADGSAASGAGGSTRGRLAQ